MKVITTVHEEGFEQYGHRWIEGMANWPAGTDFVMYAEGFETEAVRCKRVEDLPALEAFKARFRGYRPVSWEFDIVRFANKVFAAIDAFYDEDGLCVWLDADCITYAPIPEGYVESLLGDAFLGLFRRVGYHTETGFWVMDGSHPEKRAFFDTWQQWYESGRFKELTQWHDCTTLDATVRLFEKDERITVANLSGEFAKDIHPMARADLGRFIDHTKGVDRKRLGYSIENRHRIGDSPYQLNDTR